MHYFYDSLHPDCLHPDFKRTVIKTSHYKLHLYYKGIGVYSIKSYKYRVIVSPHLQHLFWHICYEI